MPQRDHLLEMCNLPKELLKNSDYPVVDITGHVWTVLHW